MSILQILHYTSIIIIINIIICLLFSISDLSTIPETTTDFFEPIFPSTFPVKATEKSLGTLLPFSSQELQRSFQRKAEIHTHYFSFSGLSSFFFFLYFFFSIHESFEDLAVEESTSQAQLEHALLDVFEISSRCFFSFYPDVSGLWCFGGWVSSTLTHIVHQSQHRSAFIKQTMWQAPP